MLVLAVSLLVTVAPAQQQPPELEGCTPVSETARLLGVLAASDWSAWPSKRAYEVLPDAVVDSEERDGGKEITFVRTDRLIAGEVKCEVSLEFSLLGSNSDGEMLALKNVYVTYAAATMGQVSAAEEKLRRAIGVPANAAVSQGGAIDGASNSEKAVVRARVWGGEVLRVRIRTAPEPRLWMRWQREGK